MGPVSHQTTKLSRGKHQSPDEGACVMELASMLAGEPFTDQPESVCPVIASFMRAYNDSIDDSRRQDLYAYAAKVVGSRGERVRPASARRASEGLGLGAASTALDEVLPALPAVAGLDARARRDRAPGGPGNRDPR